MVIECEEYTRDAAHLAGPLQRKLARANTPKKYKAFLKALNKTSPTLVDRVLNPIEPIPFLCVQVW